MDSITNNSADIDFGGVNSNIDSILGRLQKLEKNDTYQDQHLQTHQKSIDDLNKLIKSFAIKLNQLATKKGDAPSEPIDTSMLGGFDSELGDELKAQIEELSKKVKEL